LGPSGLDSGLDSGLADTWLEEARSTGPFVMWVPGVTIRVEASSLAGPGTSWDRGGLVFLMTSEGWLGTPSTRVPPAVTFADRDLLVLVLGDPSTATLRFSGDGGAIAVAPGGFPLIGVTG